MGFRILFFGLILKILHKMAKNHVCKGDVMPYTIPSGTVVSGAVVVVGNLVGVALGGGAAGETIQIALSEVFEVPKHTGSNTDFAQGVPLWWDATNGYVAETDGSGANKLLGYAWKAATTAEATAIVKLTN